jgi:hypothetical protein
MKPPIRFARLGLFHWKRSLFSLGLGLALAILVVVTQESAAQPRMNLTGSSNCNEADFETTVSFLNSSDAYYTLVLDKRNISNHPCVFDGPTYGPSVAPDRVGDKRIELLYAWKTAYPMDDVPLIGSSRLLPPGQTARQSFRWKTIPESTDTACIQPQWIGNPVLLAIPSVLKKICSPIEVSRFSLVATSEVSGVGEQDQSFSLISAKHQYFQGEGFDVHVSLAKPDARLSISNDCPTFYLRVRSPDGFTRIDEVKPLASKDCKWRVMGHKNGDWLSGFDVGSGVGSRWGSEGLGEHTLQLFALIGTADDSQLHFVSSNVLRVHLVDPATISRRWGPKVKGIAADITLDKDTYEVGEDIPLHLAVQNVDAEAPIYGPNIVWDPCGIVAIEVLDAAGRALGSNELMRPFGICSGHGFGPMVYEKGKVIPLERKLAAERGLPRKPGTYTIVVTWAPAIGSAEDALSKTPFPDLKPHAVARATATINIVNSSDPTPQK